MALPNAYAQYNNSKVMTASGPELTLLLYDGMIRFCNIAEAAVEAKDIQRAHTNIIKIQKIVDYLRQTLDTKYPVAQDFDRMYIYLLERLFDANVHKDLATLQEINQHIHAIRDTWKEVMQTGKQNGAAHE